MQEHAIVISLAKIKKIIRISISTYKFKGLFHANSMLYFFSLKKVALIGRRVDHLRKIVAQTTSINYQVELGIWLLGIWFLGSSVIRVKILVPQMLENVDRNARLGNNEKNHHLGLENNFILRFELTQWLISK